MYRFDAHGEGLVYYPNGSVAVAVSNASPTSLLAPAATAPPDSHSSSASDSKKKRFYAYGVPRRGGSETPLMLVSLDEHAVGFAVVQGKGGNTGRRLVLTDRGGILSSGVGDIEAEWKWDTGAQNAGQIPPGGVFLQLNESLSLRFVSRGDISLTFDCLGVKLELKAGRKLKRDGTSYLDGAKRRDAGTGGLDVQIPDYRTLRVRQSDFAEGMTALRNRNNPKSENLSPFVSGVVAGLERSFDGYEKNDHGSTLRLGQARKDARDQTVKELPKIKKTEQDISHSLGYSQALYLDEQSSKTYSFNAMENTRSILLRPDGKGWKTDVDIRLALCTIEHPTLPRPKFLKASSGHYFYDHNAHAGQMRPPGAETLRKVSTVKERTELRDLLQKRLADMDFEGKKLLNR